MVWVEGDFYITNFAPQVTALKTKPFKLSPAGPRTAGFPHKHLKAPTMVVGHCMREQRGSVEQHPRVATRINSMHRLVALAHNLRRCEAGFFERSPVGEGLGWCSRLRTLQIIRCLHNGFNSSFRQSCRFSKKRGRFNLPRIDILRWLVS